MRSRRALLTVSAVATVLLGLEKVGVFEFVPGADLRFVWSAVRLTDGRSAVEMRSDIGDLACWMQIVIRWDGPDTGTFTASIPGGDPLATEVQTLGPSRRSVAISKAPAPPSGTPFAWRAGLPLQFAHAGPAIGPLVVEDWTVFPSDQASDSAARATLRRTWTWVSWALLIVSIVGVGLTAWAEKDTPSVTPLALVGSIVASVEGANAVETGRLRKFLSKVLLHGVTVNEALDGLKIPKAPVYLRPQFQARARRLFLDRIALVKAELDTFAARL